MTSTTHGQKKRIKSKDLVVQMIAGAGSDALRRHHVTPSQAAYVVNRLRTMGVSPSDELCELASMVRDYGLSTTPAVAGEVRSGTVNQESRISVSAKTLGLGPRDRVNIEYGDESIVIRRDT